MHQATKRRRRLSQVERNAAAFGVAAMGLLHDQHRPIGVFQPAGAAHQAGHRAVELREHLLADRPLAVERFHVPAGLVEPDQRRGQDR